MKCKHRDTKTQRKENGVRPLPRNGTAVDRRLTLREKGLTLLFLPLCLCISVFTAAQRPSRPPSAIQLNNLGVGYMNQARIAEALQMFRRAQTQDSSLFAARLNEGIAL